MRLLKEKIGIWIIYISYTKFNEIKREYDGLEVAIFSYFLLFLCIFCAFYGVIFLK